MSCGCHGKMGAVVKRVTPFEQCSTCAKKHLVAAWSLFNEFTYTEDNLDAITGQIRLAANHLMYTHKEAALKLRDLAVSVESGELPEESVWLERLSEVRAIYYADHPDIAKKIEELKPKAIKR